MSIADRYDRFTWAELASVTGGQWTAPLPATSTGVTAVWDDTRTLPAGALFVAVIGETADGHAHLPAALAAGAAAVCIQNEPPAAAAAALRASGVPCLRVGDTLAAFQALAAAHRQRFPALPVIGITGSCGKTSTKEMIAAVLEGKWPGAVLKTEGNTNNHFGVPRNLLRLTPDHRAAVIEMGTNHPGEIPALARLVRPGLGVITNVGHAHIEYLGGTLGVAREKGALFSALPADGTAIFPADTLHTDILRQLAAHTRVMTYGESASSDIQIKYLGPGPAGYGVQFTWTAGGAKARLDWTLGGAHQALNAGAAVAIGTLIGLAPAAIVQALALCRLPGMRMQVLEIAGVHWVNDAYNSNPDSAQASLVWFQELTAAVPPGTVITVLGDMRELGDDVAPEHHRRLLEQARRLFPQGTILPVGKHMLAAAPACGLRGFADAAAVQPELQGLLKPGTWILLKGSRGIRLETLMPPVPK